MSVTFSIEHRVDVWTLRCACGQKQFNGSFKKHQKAELALKSSWLAPCSDRCASLETPGQVVPDAIDIPSHTVTLPTPQATSLLSALRLIGQGLSGSINGVVFSALANTAEAGPDERVYLSEMHRIGSYAMTHNAHVIWTD
jgi:hypothetical protein